MPQTSHLHPEWGFLVPPRSFARTARIAMIGAAVGVTAGFGIISSLAERSSEQPFVAARTLAPPASTPPSAAVKAPKIAASEPAKAAPTPAPVTRTRAALASVAAPQAQKKATKKHHADPRYAGRVRQFTSLMDDWYHAVGL